MYKCMKVIGVSFMLALSLTSCTLFAPKEEKRVREALSNSDIQYERLHRSFEGENKYSYRLTLKGNSIATEAIMEPLQTFAPSSVDSSLTITNEQNNYSLKFHGNGSEDLKEAQLLADFIENNKGKIAELHYVEPQEETPSGSKIRTVVEFSGELDQAGISGAAKEASVFTGGTVLYFNENKITLIGEISEQELEVITGSVHSIYEIIESKSPHADEYDYSIAAVIAKKEISVTKSISEDAVIDKEAIRSIPVPAGWKITV